LGDGFVRDALKACSRIIFDPAPDSEGIF